MNHQSEDWIGASKHLLPVVVSVCPTRYREVPDRVMEITSVRELCATAGIRCKASDPSAERPTVFIVDESFSTGTAYLPSGEKVCVVSVRDIPVEAMDERDNSLRILEVLAYGLFQYAARESMNGVFQSFRRK